MAEAAGGRGGRQAGTKVKGGRGNLSVAEEGPGRPKRGERREQEEGTYECNTGREEDDARGRKAFTGSSASEPNRSFCIHKRAVPPPERAQSG
jgi:hypothetical protein